MARPLRLEYPGAVYHVTARGNAREPIFFDDEDRQSFLTILGSVVNRFNWLCHAYCLMGNHYHLLIETPDGNLSRGMRQLNGVYTQKVNRRYSRVGHLFQGRFKSILVDKGSYLLELARYVVLNPVRAKLVKDPKDWEWSSYRATVGMTTTPKFLSTDWILSQFGSQREEAQAAYRHFVAEGIGKTIWGNLKGGVILGSNDFAAKVIPLLREKEPLTEVPRAQRFATRPSLGELFAGIKESKSRRNGKIYEAYMQHGYTLSEIGRELGLHYSTVSKIVRREKKEPEKSQAKT